MNAARHNKRWVVGMLAAAGLLAAGACPAQVDSSNQYLQRMDSDGDGRVSPDEYVTWLMYGFERMDRNGDGVLDAAEQPGGRGAAITREQQRQALLARFAKQDANADGFLSARELLAPPR